METTQYSGMQTFVQLLIIAALILGLAYITIQNAKSHAEELKLIRMEMNSMEEGEPLNEAQQDYKRETMWSEHLSNVQDSPFE